MTAINRRSLVWGVGALSAGGVSAAWLLTGQEKVLLSAADDANGRHFLVGADLAGRTRFKIPVPERAHQPLAIPNSHLAIFFGRRPSTQLYIVDTALGQLMASISAPKHHHFYGHGTLSQDGEHLLVTENRYHNPQGIIGVYQLKAPFSRVHELDSGGIGPHQIGLLSDGKTLAIANGGIITHPSSGRDILNRDTMQPNLAYLDLKRGVIKAQFTPQHHQMSLRHLAITQDDQVIVGVQDQRSNVAPEDTSPLVLQHQSDRALRPLEASPIEWLSMQQYIASVAVSSDNRWAMTTTPRGNLVSIWDLHEQSLHHQATVKDVAGALWLEEAKGFVFSNGLGHWGLLTPSVNQPIKLFFADPNWRWDNHLSLA